MIDGQRQPVTEHEGMLDAIGQLADIAWPDMPLEDREGFRLDDQGVGGRLRPPIADEVLDEHRDVVETITEGGNRHLEGVDAKEEILAECPRRHHLLEGAVRGTDHADIDSHGVVVTNATDLAALKRPQEPGLERPGEFADLVEEQRPPVRHLEQAGPVFLRAGERPLPVAEQLALHQMLGESAAVDGHQRPRGPGTAVVNRPGNELLAGPRLAAHKDA